MHPGTLRGSSAGREWIYFAGGILTTQQTHARVCIHARAVEYFETDVSLCRFPDKIYLPSVSVPANRYSVCVCVCLVRFSHRSDLVPAAREGGWDGANTELWLQTELAAASCISSGSAAPRNHKLLLQTGALVSSSQQGRKTRTGRILF